MLRKTLLAISISALLVGCGSTGSQSPVEKEGTIAIQVNQAKRTVEERLVCNQPSNVEAACNLRTYQVMVESFIDADSSANYGTGYGTSHHNGDIAGITASLDYIKSLGMNTIWLTPIFKSTPITGQDDWADRLDATGYFASDYFAIDPKFGTLEQAKELVNQAHAKGMYVIFDGVFGHHKGNVAASPNGLKPTTGKAQGSGFEALYPEDIEFYKEVATYWVNELQIDGWRLDQAYQVPLESWTEIRTAVEKVSAEQSYQLNGKTVNPLGYMVAEIWRGANDISEQGYGDSAMPALNSAFDFPMRYSVVQTFAVEENGFGHRNATNLDNGFVAHVAYPDHAMPNLMLGNHDLVRFGDLLQRGVIASPGDPEYWDRHKAAISFLTAYSGPITLYYGEEIGDQVDGFVSKLDPCSGDSGMCDDHVARSSAKIEGIATTVGGEITVLNEQQADLKNYVAALMKMRAEHPALYQGSRTHIHSDVNIYIDRKDAVDDNILYLVNTKAAEATITIAANAIGSDGDLVNLMANETVSFVEGEYVITLPPYSAAFYDITSPTTDGPQVGVAALSRTGTGVMANCTKPSAGTLGPLGKDIWIRGTYTGGDGFAATPDSHKFNYIGGDLYQVVVKHPTPTAYTFKFATKSWGSEFAVEDSDAVKLGTTQSMARAPGPGTESSIMIPEAGTYVYSFKINDFGDAGEMMVSQCE
ncbi:glycosidase [Psychromonas marina]|uniref:Glycosidase n=1 Tax=Psychromonas marina TaxID=88364 RepID=A0ABQ6E1F2_9GAMM|nr:alpha-amylase family glycosyl hydrolase [Psychromonas marina]GLS91020.1 glycosidase [Psychromonas marina]